MDMHEEIRNGYTVTAQMKRVWAIQMDMAKKLIEVCDRNGLKVWAASGTLLGCVRDHGFIPWDDDIDMVMLRDDYDKLVSIAEKEFTHPYFFQTAYSEKAPYPREHAQMRYANTAAILPYDIFADFDQSIFIDIFVMDGIPEDSAELTPEIMDILKRDTEALISDIISYYKNGSKGNPIVPETLLNANPYNREIMDVLKKISGVCSKAFL